MDIATLKHFLFWSSLVNYGVLLVWYLVLLLAREPMLRLWERSMGVGPELAAAANFRGMMYYKLAIIFLNVVPCIALYIVT